jgi:hypothetical protein
VRLSVPTRRAVAFVAAALLAVGGCASGSSVPGLGRGEPRAPEPVCADTGFDCELQGRFEAVRDYLDGRPGTSGVVVRDLRTGARWHNEHARDLTWTASTIKLAMVVDLLTRNRSGEITLTGEDRALIHAMLHDSDDRAADTLWYRYAGPDHRAFNDNFPAYGLTSLVPQRGFSDYFPYWGFQKCTPEDLDRLMTFVLTELPGEDRDLIVEEMRSVGTEQQWGVWGAGPAARPGTKDGWSEEADGWVMNTVGFVGPDERFTLTVMNTLHGQGGYTSGRATVTQVAHLLFAGYFRT